MSHDPAQDASPAEKLRSRAAATDRAARFEHRLAAVERGAVRRGVRRRVVRVLRLLSAVGAGALVPVVVAALVGSGDPSGLLLLGAGVLGGLLLLGVDRVLLVLARRRGSEAWDWHHERYVLLGNPSRDVQEADRPGRATGGPLG